MSVCFLFDVSFGGIKTSGVSHLTDDDLKKCALDQRPTSVVYLVSVVDSYVLMNILLGWPSRP